MLILPDGHGIGGDHDPRWSPDGSSLLISLVALDPARWQDPPRTWELPIDGRPPRLVPADDPRSHWDATWSGDGALVAFADRAQATTWSLVVATADGSGARELVSVPDRYDEDAPWPGDLLMSPAGDRVVFRTNGSPDELLAVDLATGALTTLVEPTDRLRPLAYAPDGGRVLLAAEGPDGGAMWSVGVDGSDARLLVAGTVDGAWRPPLREP